MLMSESGFDQAAGLRRLISNTRPVRVIAVTSGKGGVGKSNISVNLAVTLARQGQDLMVMDADLGLANLDILLGLKPSYNLSHVISGEQSLEEIIVKGPAGIMIVPASSGIQRMAELSQAENVGLIRAFSNLTHPLDTFIIDTAAGISDSVMSFVRAAQEVVVVVCDEPASITDAYAMIKVMSREYQVEHFHVLANMTRSAQHGRDLFQKLLKVADRYLDVTLHFMGAIPFDEQLRQAVTCQKPVVDASPRSISALAIKKLVQKMDSWPPPVKADGNLEFFIERLIRFSASKGVGIV